MTDLAQILEEELEEAVEVKNRKSLHRYIALLTDNLVGEKGNSMEHTEFQQELIKIDGRFNQMITEVREGFKRMDERFEAINKRFETVDKRFAMMFSFITIGFVVMATMMSVFQFLG